MRCRQCLYKPLLCNESTDIDFYTLVDLLKEFYKYGAYKVSFLGGEPTLYKDKKNSKDKFKRATIGEFLEEMDKAFNVKIDQRFKGKLAHALIKPH